MTQEETFKIHEFLKKHELERVESEGTGWRKVEVCKHCGMVFLFNEPFTRFGNPGALFQLFKKRPDLLPKYSLETYKSTGSYGEIWWAAWTKDPQEEVLRQVLAMDDSSYIKNQVCLWYAHAVGHKQVLLDWMLKNNPYAGSLFEYNKAVGTPIPEIRKRCYQDKYLAPQYYFKIDSPYFSELVEEIGKKKSALWEQMKPAWKNTKLYNSPWYKELEAQHAALNQQQKNLHEEKMSYKKLAYNKEVK